MKAIACMIGHCVFHPSMEFGYKWHFEAWEFADDQFISECFTAQEIIKDKFLTSVWRQAWTTQYHVSTAFLNSYTWHVASNIERILDQFACVSLCALSMKSIEYLVDF